MAFAVLVKHLLEIIFPSRCAGCRAKLEALDERGICLSCLEKVRRNPRPQCGVCGKPLATTTGCCLECRMGRYSFSLARSACLHEGVIKELIHSFKYRGRAHLGKVLSLFLGRLLEEESALLRDVDAVTFVPLHPGRLRMRSYNQSQVLARHLSRRFGIPIWDILDKRDRTRPQNELTKQARLVNLTGTMKTKRRRAVSGLTLLLIDDVMATGATLDEASRALLASGAREVRCLTVSRGL